MPLHWLLIVAATTLIASSALAVKPTRSEMGLAKTWVAERLGTTPRAPFSFMYGGKPSAELLSAWKVARSTRRLDGSRTERTVSWTDPATGLVATCRAVVYRDFPTVEWIVSLKNAGPKDTPLIQHLRALDVELPKMPGDREFVVHHMRGSQTLATDYEPLQTALPAGQARKFASAGGRPMNVTTPYFNLDWGDGGMILVLSWVGEWEATFGRVDGEGLHVTGGQQNTRFVLHPGEEVRTPLVVLQFWKGGGTVRAQNVWRRWMIAHNLPRPGGKPFPPVLSSQAPDAFPGYVFGAKDELPLIEGHAQHGLKIDFWWRDAGWYPCSGHWWNTGTWESDPVNYPKGLRETADAAHKLGYRFTVWFEPERVVAGTWLWNTHPEWLLGPAGGQKLLDLANPAAYHWLVDHIDRLITDNHIDMYRQDYNVDPIGYWRHGEPEDRQGITEIRQIEGLLSLWDELARRHPGMPFDCCASGGQRNVLEMMRRGVPLSKSDLAGGTTSSQCQLYGIASWLPYFGAGTGTQDPYAFRSNYSPWTGINPDTRRADLNYALVRKHIAERRRVAPYFWGDFYPLTAYSLAENVWMAWQFDRPEKGDGMVEAFRREKCSGARLVVRLSCLNADASYRVENVDGGAPVQATGRDLMTKGYTIEIGAQPGAAILFYRKTRGAKP